MAESLKQYEKEKTQHQKHDKHDKHKHEKHDKHEKHEKHEPKQEEKPKGQDEALAALKLNASQFLQRGILSFEQGRFLEALPLIQQAIGSLIQQPNGYQTFQQELIFLAWYHQVIHFLIEIQRLQTLKLYEQIGLVSKYLCEIPIQSDHRLTLVRLALKINFQLGNFGTSGRLITLIGPLQLPEQPTLMKMYSKCQELQFEDKSQPLKQSAKLCFKTLRLIQSDAFDQCLLCSASFRPGLSPNCSFCNFPLQTQSISALMKLAQEAAAQAQQAENKKV